MGELLPSNGGAVGGPEGTGVVAGLWMTCGSGGVDTRSGVSVIEGPVAGHEDAGLSIGPLGARGVGMATGGGVRPVDGASGVKARRNRRLREVNRLDPSSMMRYCRNGRAATTTPRRSQSRGWLPDWFCTRTH